MSQTLSKLLHTSQNFEMYFLKNLRLSSFLQTNSPSRKTYPKICKLSYVSLNFREISQTLRVASGVLVKSRLISQTSPRTLKDPRRILRIHPGTPEDSLKLPLVQSVAERWKGRMLTAISHVALIYRSRSKRTIVSVPRRDVVDGDVVVRRCSIAWTKWRGAISVLRGSEARTSRP